MRGVIVDGSVEVQGHEKDSSTAFFADLVLFGFECDFVRRAFEFAGAARILCNMSTEMEELRDTGRVAGDKDEVGFQ